MNKDGKDAQVYTIKEDGLLKYFIQVLGLNTDGPVFGANANNELFLGRLAMIGFAVSTFLDALGPDRGLGPLAQLGKSSIESISVADPRQSLTTTKNKIYRSGDGTGGARHRGVPHRECSLLLPRRALPCREHAQGWKHRAQGGAKEGAKEEDCGARQEEALRPLNVAKEKEKEIRKGVVQKRTVRS